MTYISSQIHLLHNIHEIDLVSNPLRKGMSYDYLDSIFSELRARYINLTSCGFQEFPCFIETMDSLKSLVFLHNKVDSIPKDLELESFHGVLLIDIPPGWEEGDKPAFFKKYGGKIVFWRENYQLQAKVVNIGGYSLDRVGRRSPIRAAIKNW